MGLSVGGIHVRTADRERVVAAVRAHWLGLGARPLAEGEDPLALAPLDVAKTGKLGYAVWPAAADPDGEQWVAVYDSERYHGSAELARYLAEALDCLVVLYSFTSSVDAASMTTFKGASPQEPWQEESDDWGEIESAIVTLPFALVYYNQLARAEPGALDEVRVFGFQELPYREGSSYRGPSGEELRGQALLAQVARAIAAGDVAAVRAAYQAEPSHRYEILTAVTDGARRELSAQTVVLAMAEELLADPEAYWRVSAVAEAALLAGDDALFQRAARTLGRHVSGLEGLANRLLQAKDFRRAVQVLRAVIADDGVALTAWNQLAHALSQWPEGGQGAGGAPLPADTAALLDRCDAHGMANSWIFHNTACAWIRLMRDAAPGDRARCIDRALAAVRGAVRAGYPELAKLRADADLQVLFDDPRFAAAFEEAEPISLEELVVQKTHQGATYVVQRPVLRFTFFLEPRPVDELGPQVAALVEAYLADLPDGALTSAQRNGPWKKLAKGQATRDLNKLRAAKKDSFISLDYRGDTDEGGGAPTEYGLHVELWGESEEFGAHDKVPVISLWFPAALAAGDVDAVAERFARYCGLVPVEAAGAGLEVILRQSDYVEVWWESGLLEAGLKRFFGTEPHPFREWKKGRAAGAMWLTFLSRALGAALGGAAALAERVAPALVAEQAGGGVVMRASLRPALGVGPVPRDLGALPNVARALEPLVVTREDDEDLGLHYRRLHDVPVTAYDNGPPVVRDEALRQPRAAAPPGKKRAARAKKPDR
jgi:Protein of unknown function (DUF3396)